MLKYLRRRVRTVLEPVTTWDDVDPSRGWQAVVRRPEDLRVFQDRVTQGWWFGDGDCYGQYRYAMFAFAFAIASEGLAGISVCDFGGSLGNLYYVARTVRPGTTLDFHCVELPFLAEVGARCEPRITWHTGEDWRRYTYDLVVCSGTLQYVREWRDTLAALVAASRRLVLLTLVPIGPRTTPMRHWLARDAFAMHWVFSRPEFEQALAELPLRVLCRFTASPPLAVRGWRDSVHFHGWLCEVRAR